MRNGISVDNGHPCWWKVQHAIEGDNHQVVMKVRNSDDLTHNQRSGQELFAHLVIEFAEEQSCQSWATQCQLKGPRVGQQHICMFPVGFLDEPIFAAMRTSNAEAEEEREKRERQRGRRSRRGRRRKQAHRERRNSQKKWGDK